MAGSHGELVVGRAQVHKKRQITLPQEVQDALHLSEGDEVEFIVHPDGEVRLRGITSIPTDQRWFWTDEWQAGEDEASVAIAVKDTTVYYSTEDFLAYLDEFDVRALDADIRKPPATTVPYRSGD